jgi:hypothetical protein
MNIDRNKWLFGDNSTLLIVGNGFDLNLGLKTSYADFIASEQFLEICNSNNFAKYLKSKIDIQRWVDIENEIPQYLSGNFIDRDAVIDRESPFGESCIIINGKKIAVYEAREFLTNNLKQFKTEYKEIKNTLVSYLQTQVISANLDNYKDTEAYYLLSKVKNLGNLYVLNFNYTSSIEKLIRFMKVDAIFGINILHIHGSIEDDGIVFGIQDEINSKIKESLSEYPYVYKSSSIYLQSYGINKLFEQCVHIIFFGYSLGETDSSYFNDFFEDLVDYKVNKKFKKIDIFYRDEEALDSLNSRIRDLTDGKVSTIRKNHDISLLPLSKIRDMYTEPKTNVCINNIDVLYK